MPEETSGASASVATHRLRGRLWSADGGKSVTVPTRGRVPKWCSATCRNKGWQANHAPTQGPVRVVQQRVQVPVPTLEPRNVGEWVELLEVLATRLAQGRIYTRDLPVLVPTINRLIEVTDRRLRER